MLHPAIARFFAATGTTLEETCYRPFPASLVPERLTTAEQLVEAERLNQRDRRPALAPLASHEIVATGSERHRQFGVIFRFTDGTEQAFAPHSA